MHKSSGIKKLKSNNNVIIIIMIICGGIMWVDNGGG
jgi:hypothetical protein